MNWGKGITIFMLAFIGFIGTMVYVAFTKNADLVRDDYYENELAFDQLKTDKSNYTHMGTEIHFEKNENGVTFLFPPAMTGATDGTISFYRPDQKKHDREFELAINENGMQLLPYSNFKEGYYDITIQWKDQAQMGYIFESNIQF